MTWLVIKIILAIELSAALYRVPRGGPAREVWAEILPTWLMRVWGSNVASGIWATGSAIVLTAATGAPWWLAPIVAIAMWAGENPGYPIGGYGAAGVDIKAMNRRGLLLLNPLLGKIYWCCWRLAHDGPERPTGRLSRVIYIGRLPFLDGWSAWAEWFCGRVTAAGYAAILILLARIFQA